MMTHRVMTRVGTSVIFLNDSSFMTPFFSSVLTHEPPWLAVRFPPLEAFQKKTTMMKHIKSNGNPIDHHHTHTHACWMTLAMALGCHRLLPAAAAAALWLGLGKRMAVDFCPTQHVLNHSSGPQQEDSDSSSLVQSP